jgi:DNA-binding CsgD family transcriptional regulator
MNQSPTPREMQVAELLAWGFTNKEVARQLYISELTVKTHRKHFMEKTGTRNLADITRWYFGETKGYYLGPAPVLRKILALFFLLLALSIEYLHIDAMRVRTFRVRTESLARAKRKKRDKKTLILS